MYSNTSVEHALGK